MQGHPYPLGVSLNVATGPTCGRSGLPSGRQDPPWATLLLYPWVCQHDCNPLSRVNEVHSQWCVHVENMGDLVVAHWEAVNMYVAVPHYVVVGTAVDVSCAMLTCSMQTAHVFQ